jgi:hypothetical protein
MACSHEASFWGVVGADLLGSFLQCGQELGGRLDIMPLRCVAQDSLSCSVTLSPRQGLPRISLRGIFQGAKVVRGPDWEWGSQDGEWWLEAGQGGKAGL